MLTIEEIKKELDADRKVIAELEDPNGLRKLGTSESFIQEWINNDVSIRAYNCIYFITSNGVGIPHDNLISYFRIKRPAPTFTDLTKAATKAVEDGLLTSFTINVMNYSDKIGETLFLGLNMTAHNIANEINNINSLYTETFVIEKDGDIAQIKEEAKVILTNRNEFVAKNMKILKDKREMIAIKFTDADGYQVVYGFFELKGATVTQKRGGV